MMPSFVAEVEAALFHGHGWSVVSLRMISRVLSEVCTEVHQERMVVGKLREVL